MSKKQGWLDDIRSRDIRWARTPHAGLEPTNASRAADDRHRLVDLLDHIVAEGCADAPGPDCLKNGTTKPCPRCWIILQNLKEE